MLDEPQDTRMECEELDTWALLSTMLTHHSGKNVLHTDTTHGSDKQILYDE